MRRSKKKARGNPLKNKSEKLQPIVQRDVKPGNGKSLGFGRDKARASLPSPSEEKKR